MALKNSIVFGTSRPIRKLSAFAFLGFLSCCLIPSNFASGQVAPAQVPQPLVGTPAAAAAMPSLDGSATAGLPSNVGVPTGVGSSGIPSQRPARTGGAPALPTDANQYWETYDLRPYTKELASMERPQQAIIDWILRDTGTDVWFTEPFGFLNADRNTLRVYHNDQMHQLVRQSYERFVNGTTVPQAFGLRLIAVGNPNWRTRGHTLLRSVAAQSPGVNAFLASKENNALLMAMLRGRSDFKELASVTITTPNGQPQVLEQLRSRNFVREFQRADSWPPYLPVTGEIQEGYRLQLSPLLSVDRQFVDLLVKCQIDQVEKFANVTLELPLPTGQVHSGQIQVPQLSSWRLHERFRWRSDEVLILSCGVVAAPQAPSNNTLLGQGSSLIGLNRILPQTGERADALLVVEYLGDGDRTRLPSQAGAASTGVPTTALQNGNSPVTRGRY